MLEEEYETSRRVPPPHLRRRPPPSAPFGYEIRPAEPGDLGGVQEIYNHYVLNTVVTFDEEATTSAYWQERFDYLQRLGLPFLVAVSPAGQVLGYALVNPWRQRGGFRHTVENSIYLSPAAQGRGLGGALLEALLDACRTAGIREVVAVISDKGAEASIRLHERFGFAEVGRLGKVGFKFGRWLGTVLLQKSLKERRSRKGRERRGPEAQAPSR